MITFQMKRALVTGMVVFASLVLNACGKSDATAPAAGSGNAITVSGKVIGENMQPVSGVPVLITGLTPVNTDGNGGFTITNVRTPYTIAAVDGPNNRAIIYRGLTRPDPTLVWLGVVPGTPKTAALSGNIIPWAATGATTKTVVLFISPEASGLSIPAAATGAYSISGISWYGSATTVGSVHTLQWDLDANTFLPTSFRKYGTRAGITLLDAATNSNGSDTVSSISSGVISGTMTAASGYAIVTKGAVAILGGSGGIAIAGGGGSIGSFSYVTPNIPGTTISLTCLATKAGAGSSSILISGLSPNGSGLSFSIPAAPELSLPINAATAVNAGTPFSWSPVPGGVHAIHFIGNAGNPSYIVLTSAASDSIPDLSSAGLPLPHAAAYRWSVISYGPFASLDAAAGPAGFLSGVNSMTSNYTYGTSVTRTFTSAP